MPARADEDHSTCVEHASGLPALRGGGRGLEAWPSKSTRERKVAHRKNSAQQEKERGRNRKAKAEKRADSEYQSKERERNRKAKAEKRTDPEYQRKERVFAAEKARRVRVTEQDVLYLLHASKASRIVANSMRLRTLRRKWMAEGTAELKI